jgi:NADP-dependent 3-hydroxy acid dehydrogenase YdfG
VSSLNGKVAWVTGASSGIGEAAALALAKEGVAVGLTGRRQDALEAVAAKIEALGSQAMIAAGDVTEPETPQRLAKAVAEKFGKLDILVNNAGANVLERSWAKLNPERIKTVLDSNLTSTFLCAQAALAIMRGQKDGLLIHTASWAGRFIGPLSGPAYVAAKYGVVAMSYTINMEEFMHGIRSTVLCPNEVATPILERRPVPVPQADRDRMIQPAHMSDLIVYIAKLPASICINEVVISPTWNRGYAQIMGVGPKIS